MGGIPTFPKIPNKRLPLHKNKIIISMFKPSLFLVVHQGSEAFFLHNLLKDKTAMEKLWLVLKCVPLFSLNTFFRVGSAVPKVDMIF